MNQNEKGKVDLRPVIEKDVVIVGSGFAGLYMLHRIRQLGLSVIEFEQGNGVGGTWFWNRYPGARCDVDSLEYSFSFDEELQQEWSWSERFATQPEILKYLDHVADRFDLRRDIQLSTTVTAAVFDEAVGRWLVTTDRGDRVSARFCLMATGCLSTARAPDLPGAETFTGRTLHTGHWPQEPVDLTGLRVGVIGTGSSGIQVSPALSDVAGHLTVFQRTPNFSIPARNAPTDREREREWKKQYAQKREAARETTAGILYDYNTVSAIEVTEQERIAAYEARWAKGGVNFIRTFADIMLDKRANDTAADFVRGKIRETVKDETVARKLLPHDHPIGTKRICVDSRYFETFNKPNVTLVDLRAEPIERLTPAGLVTSAGEYPLDVLVFATGFDAVTGSLGRIDIRGRHGLVLKEKWKDGPRCYLGLMSAGLPNFFMITGPGSPSILTNVIVSIEQHVEWIADALKHLLESNIAFIEADEKAEDEWVDHVGEVAGKTLMVLANSWYMGANIPGKPRVFLPYAGGFNNYRKLCAEVVAEGYRGFRFSGDRAIRRSA
jgi:cyclohexanone monooxygenase